MNSNVEYQGYKLVSQSSLWLIKGYKKVLFNHFIQIISKGKKRNMEVASVKVKQVAGWVVHSDLQLFHSNAQPLLAAVYK